MLVGAFQNSIDAKGRMNVPAKLRTKLGDSCMLVKGFDDCLYLYSIENWKKYDEEHIASRPDEDESARLLKIFFYSNSWECDIDKQGRINLPSDYISFAEIEKEVTCVGLGDRIGVWAKDRYEGKMGGKEMNPKKLIAAMKEYI